MNGIGPVEPVEPADSPQRHAGWGELAAGGAHGPDDPEPPLLEERRHALRPGTRHAVRTAALALAATGVLLTVRSLPGPAAHRTGQLRPVPFPANVTSVHYVGLAAPTRPGTFAGRFRFTVSVEHGTAVRVQVVGAAFDGLTARIEPRLQVTVPARSSRSITVDIAVADCVGLPRDPDLPFLDVTLRNTRAMQAHSFLFGGTYARDVSALVRGACEPSPAR